MIHEDTPVMMNVHVLMGTIPSHISAMEESFYINNDNIPETRSFSREKTEVQVHNERSIAIGAS
jgi:competence transcription factor ComK